MKVAMLIVHYNDYESTINLLENIKDYKLLSEIVVVDNNSNELNKNKIKNYIKSKKITLIENNENRGFSSAINEGSKYIINKIGDCIIFISNADVIINKEEDLKKIIKPLNEDDISISAPVVLENNNKNRGWKAVSPLIDSLLNLPYIHRHIRKKYVFYKDDYYNAEYSKVDIVSGCFFAIKSKDLEMINYLDENVFLYYEENILSKKIKKIDKNIVICNNVSIIHNHSVSIDKNINKLKKLKIQKQSQYYFHTKYNNANIIEKILLKITVFIAKIMLTIYYFLKDLLKK